MADGVQGSIVRVYGPHLGMRPEHVPPAPAIVVTSLDPPALPAPPSNLRLAGRPGPLGPALLAALGAPSSPLDRRNAMRRFALALALVLAAPAAPAWPQPASSVAVDIETAVLAWDWAKGTGGDVVEFHVTCGPPGQPPSIQHVVTDPAARSVPLKTVVQATGELECAVAAVNQFGKSAPSNAVVFSAGTLPAPPTNLRIVSPQ